MGGYNISCLFVFLSNYSPHLRRQIIYSVPISKWNITKFSGDCSTVSLNAFLENVNELSNSRNVSKDQLFHSAFELLTGRALIFFRSIKNKVRDWDSLVTELRAQFQPADYNDRLWQEIRDRTQGNRENMGMYIAIMENLFCRLTVPINESTKVKVLMKNINPFYQNQLGLTHVSSVDHLLQLGRQLEARKEAIESYAPPSRNTKSLMEPDLAYISTDRSEASSSTSGRSFNVGSRSRYRVSEVSQGSNKNVANVKYWNCGDAGHLSTRCSKPQRKYCYKCGQPEVTSRTCSKCNRNSGNASGRR